MKTLGAICLHSFAIDITETLHKNLLKYFMFVNITSEPHYERSIHLVNHKQNTSLFR